MIRRLILLVALVIGVTAIAPALDAKPARTERTKRKPKKPNKAKPPTPPAQPATPATPAPDPAAPPSPAPTPAPASTDPGPATTPVPSAAAPASNAPGAVPTPVATPTPSAPTLAMRPKPRAHGGFVDDLDCSACHTAAGWQLSSSAGASGFDHDRTGFPLRGAHTQSQCSRCHTGAAKPATSCDGCHRDPHQGRNDGTCAECHTATAWSDTRTLDQHRRTRMPLTGRHAVLDCSACHTRQSERTFSDTPTDCFSCHRADYLGADPQIHHLGPNAAQTPFGRDCASCHNTMAWRPAYGVSTSGLSSPLEVSGRHDAVFVLSTGSHRAAECALCHIDARRTKAVRCDGCHVETVLRAQHRRPVSRAASACLRCHPRGAAR